MFDGKILLVTGGTGSFGNAVLDRFLNTNVKEIRIFSRDEKKQDDMRNKYKNEKIKFYLGDVRDLASIENAIQGVDFVFHAAALKQVPSCEFFPIEAVKTNIIGTDNLLTAAIKYGVKRVVCLSTDKAPYPVNAMGMSKALMEKVIIAKARKVDEANKTVICCTRYGNVLCSRGSVVPVFINQIKQGLPLTVTDPDMTRFLMTLDEAVELVIFAFQNGKNGDLFVHKAPSSTIGNLAEAVRQTFNAENPIKIIGLRHGERMHEVLLTKEECSSAIDLGKFYRVPLDKRSLNYEKYLTKGDKSISSLTEFNSVNTQMLSVDQVKEKLREGLGEIL